MNLSSGRVESPASTINQTSSAPTSSRSIGTHRNYASVTPAMSLQEGQVIKGEITDLRNNEVTVTLEDNTSITGHVPDSTNLSIGQTASFKITDLSLQGISLEVLSSNYTNSQNITIAKALEEAGLPKNVRNMKIVRELLNHQLPIHKQSIQQMIQQSTINKDISIETLVLMRKFNIPVEEGLAHQFDNYRNGEHSLLHHVESMSNTLPALLNALAENGPEDAVASFGNRLISILSNQMSASTNLDLDLSFLPIADRSTLVAELQNMLPPGHPLLDVNGSLMFKNSLLDGDIPLRDAIQLINKILSSETNPIQGNPATNLPDQSSISPSPALQAILEHLNQQLQGMQQVNHELGSVLAPEQRGELLSLMRHSPLSQELKVGIQSGTATLSETIDAIQDQLTSDQFAGAKAMFSSTSFHSILRDMIQTSWTLTPAQLMKKENVENFYPKMLQELRDLSALIQSNLAGQDSDNLAGQGKSMQQNIEFMKTLNDMFSYIQLPVHLQGKNIHSELFVYTKKNELKKHPGKMKVLLHLDMENLGSLDIHISLDNNLVESTFYCTDTFSKSILETNIELLETSLAEKGFLFHAKCEESQQKVDIVKDFMEQGVPSAGVKRYMFDIRA